MLLDYIEFVSTISKHYLNDSIMKETPNATCLPNKSLRIGKVHKPMYTFFDSFDIKYTFDDYSSDNLIEARYTKSKQELGISTLCEHDFTVPAINILDNGYHPNDLMNRVESMLPPTGNIIILIEQPEIGYDMQTQTEIGLTLASIVVTYDRVQLIVETHSECLLNGMRLGMGYSNLANGDVRINHLTREDNTTVNIPIAIRANGNIEIWPDGFFDEQDKFLKEKVGF